VGNVRSALVEETAMAHVAFYRPADQDLSHGVPSVVIG
jgi:hypothetical protein